MKPFISGIASLLLLASCAPKPMRTMGFSNPQASHDFWIGMTDHPGKVEASAQHVGPRFNVINGPVEKSVSKEEFNSIWDRLHSVDLRKLNEKAQKLPRSQSYSFMVGLTSGKDRQVYKVPKRNAPTAVKSVVRDLQKYDDL
ncbi:hypothetical protein [Luteolibacter luteus]|uniref:Uncharacterized protein n=1 Tax=Luteolibacter luteus TaxID=2728835 RepID=A0A858RH18_9BACT|nr:hypothetical protein [Luteolibacter luteus]QJE95570.1 hypothetical protein HHL09_07145 [Luteolibacter luteus]